MITIAKSVNFGSYKSGLNTVGYTLTNNDGSINTARTTTGISEIVAGTGIYGGDINFPDGFSGFILWDTGDGNPVYATDNYDYRSYQNLQGQGTVAPYTYVPSTNVGLVRNLIGDVGPTFFLSDDEINAMFMLNNQDYFMTASMACYRIAASQIALSVIRKAGNFSQDLTSIAANYMKIGDKYEEMAANVPADAQAEVIATDFNYNQMLTDWVHRGQPFDSF